MRGKRCPACNGHMWPDGTYGAELVCPVCKAIIRIAKGDRPRIASKVERHSYTSKFSVTAARRQAVVNGLVMCEACLQPFPLNDTVQGTIEPWEDPETGKVETQKIRVQVGHTFVDGNLEPSYAERVIPKNTRGRICISCTLTPGFHFIGRMETPKDEYSFSLSADVRTPSDQRQRDPDPNWAHNGDPTWIAGARLIKRKRSNGLPSKLGQAVTELVWFDDEPPETNDGDLELLARQVKRVPLLRILPARTGSRKWSIDRLLNARFKGLTVSPAPTIGHMWTEKDSLTKCWVTRFIVEPSRKPTPLRSIGCTPEPRNKCKHGIQPFKAFDRATQSVVYCCTMCAPR